MYVEHDGIYIYIQQCNVHQNKDVCMLLWNAASPTCIKLLGTNGERWNERWSKELVGKSSLRLQKIKKTDTECTDSNRKSTSLANIWVRLNMWILLNCNCMGKMMDKPWDFRVPNMLSPQTIQLSSYPINRCYPVELSKNSQLFMNKSQHPWIFAAELWSTFPPPRQTPSHCPAGKLLCSSEPCVSTNLYISIYMIIYS